eukprot:7189813-Prymnesium_polylepis.1
MQIVEQDAVSIPAAEDPERSGARPKAHRVVAARRETVPSKDGRRPFCERAPEAFGLRFGWANAQQEYIRDDLARTRDAAR